MSEIRTPRDLFLHELADVLYVEEKLEQEILPKLMEEARSDVLRKGFEKHIGETRGHVENLEEIFSKLGEEPKAEECIAFLGLVREHDQLVGESAPDLIDLVVSGAAARTEHYEIAAYESLIAMARGLDEKDVIPLLESNLKEEKETLHAVEKAARRLSKERVQATAQS